jgi:hypothetical protein
MKAPSSPHLRDFGVLILNYRLAVLAEVSCYLLEFLQANARIVNILEIGI